MVIVIGGGPAGMMSAIQASKTHEVLLLEKNSALGRKLLLTGNGRCNFSNNQPIPKFVQACHGEPKFLYSHLNQFGTKEMIEFLNERGCAVILENDRYYPKSMKAREVLDLLEKEVRGCCQVKTGVEVIDWIIEANKITQVVTSEGILPCDHVILATGGYSYPQTGSTGDGFKWLKQSGHEIRDVFGSEVGLVTANPRLSTLAGLALSSRSITLAINQRPLRAIVEDVLFTHVGISGPAILDLSYDAMLHLLDGKLVEIRIALLTEPVNYISQKTIRNYLEEHLPKRLAKYILEELNLPPETVCNQIRKQHRQELESFLNAFIIPIKDSLPIEKATVTAGGLKLSEVNPKTLISKNIQNLSVCGELLNVVGPVGGYNLTIAFTTGYAAGSNIGL